MHSVMKVLGKCVADWFPYDNYLFLESMTRLSIEQSSEDGDNSSIRSSTERIKIPTQQRCNATMHVCWHRNTSVSSSDHLISLKVRVDLSSLTAVTLL